MAFIVPKYADEVTLEYLRSALNAVFGGNSYYSEISDKFVRVLLSDYKRKARNLAWFLKDDTGRVRNYIELTPEPAVALKELVDSDSVVRDIVAYLDSSGIDYTPESFLENKCVVNKQTMKITKVIRNRNGVDFANAITDSFELKVNLKVEYTVDSAYLDDTFSINESTLIALTDVKFTPAGALLYNTDGSLAAVIHKEDIKVSTVDNLSALTESQLASVFNNINSGNMKVSIDLADILTCSSGNCRSCLGIDKEHSSGALMAFRSDFSLISFTHDRNDRLYKQGRSWLFLRATEDSHISKVPFFKQQKAYGSVSISHKKALTTMIKDKIAQELGITATFGSCDTSIGRRIASPNVRAVNEDHMIAPGYLDPEARSNKEECWYIPNTHKNKIINYGQTLLVFPDPLGLDGELTTLPSFVRDHRGEYWGALSTPTHEVTCKGSGKLVMAVDAINVNGDWYSAEYLEGTLGVVPKEQPDEEPKVATISPVAEPEDAVILDAIDIDEF